MTRIITLLLAATSLSLAGMALPASAADTDVVAKVGTQSITEGDLTLAAGDLGEQFEKLPPEQRKLAVLSALIDIKSLAQEAEKTDIEKDPVVQARIAFLRERALHNAYFQKQGVDGIKDEELKARYDAELAKLKPVEEVHARHILVKTKEEAEAVIKELDGGADFMTLAASKSAGPSGPEGGDLGFFGPGQMVPPFEKAAYALEVGKYTEAPIETQFGWHVIQVTEKRPQPQPSFDDVKDQVRQVLMREKYMAIVQK
ncbi:MAG: peptidylprolyl isomerase, partial [Hyphomicrobiales bacterium]